MAVDLDQFQEFLIDSPEQKKANLKDFEQFIAEDPTISEQVELDTLEGENPTLAIVKSLGKRIAQQQTPEELIDEGFNVHEAALISTGQEALMPFLSYGNAILGGIPSEILKEEGIEDAFKIKEFNVAGLDVHPVLLNMPTQIAGFTRGPLKLAGKFAKPLASALTSGGGKVLSGISNSLLKTGIPQKISSKLATAIGSELSRDTLAGAMQWGLATGINTPEGELKNYVSRKQRAKAGVIGGALFGAGSNRLNKLKNMISKEAEAAKSLRKGVSKAFSKRGESYDNSMYNASLQTPRVNMTKEIDTLSRHHQNLLEKSAGVKRVLKGVKIPGKKGVSIPSEVTTQEEFSAVGKLLNNKENVTARQLQDAINELKGGFSEAKLAGHGMRPGDKPLEGLINKLVKLKHNKFPGTGEIDDVYGELSDKLDIFDNLKLGKTISRMKTALKDPEQVKVLKQLVGDTLYKEVRNAVFYGALGKQTVGLGKTFLKYGILYKLMQKTFNKGFNDSDMLGRE